MVGAIRFRAKVGGCMDPPGELIIDDVHIVNDPVCADSGMVPDPGFERAAADPTLLPSIGTSFWAQGSAVVTTDPALAHTGVGALELSVTKTCSSAHAWVSLEVPAPSPLGGAALRFWYDVPERSWISTTVEGIPLTEGGGWTQGLVCLEPQYAGRPTDVSFFFQASSPSGPPCAPMPIPPETVRFDDLEVGWDPSCP